jgi:hypothetical protein
MQHLGSLWNINKFFYTSWMITCLESIQQNIILTVLQSFSSYFLHITSTFASASICSFLANSCNTDKTNFLGPINLSQQTVNGKLHETTDFLKTWNGLQWKIKLFKSVGLYDYNCKSTIQNKQTHCFLKHGCDNTPVNYVINSQASF